LICLSGVGPIVSRREGPRKTEMRQWIQGCIDQFSAMVDDAPKLGGGFGGVFQLQLSLASHVRGPEFRDLCMIEWPHRLEQLRARDGCPA
jgi:hypothetical protein